MKVWVPIDLPDGFAADHVVVKSKTDENIQQTVPVTDRHRYIGMPYQVAPTLGRPLSQRWEYRIVSPEDLGDRTMPLDTERGCNALGSDGWECFHVNPGAVWFKRLRLT